MKQVAATLCSLVTHPRDEAFQFGGGEFAVALCITDPTGANIVAEIMRKTIEEMPLNIEKQPTIITISSGVSVFAPLIWLPRICSRALY